MKEGREEVMTGKRKEGCVGGGEEGKKGGRERWRRGKTKVENVCVISFFFCLSFLFLYFFTFAYVKRNDQPENTHTSKTRKSKKAHMRHPACPPCQEVPLDSARVGTNSQDVPAGATRAAGVGGDSAAPQCKGKATSSPLHI